MATNKSSRKEKMCRVMVADIPPEQHMKLRMACLEDNISICKLIQGLVENYLSVRDKEKVKK